MIKIQIVILFTKLSELSWDIIDKAKKIVEEEYCRQFERSPSDVTVEIFDGNANGNNEAVRLYIDSNEHQYNEGLLRMNMRNEISDRYRLLFSSVNGFNGVVTMKDGPINVTHEKKQKDFKASSQSEKSSDVDSRKDPTDLEDRSKMYQAVEPKYSFDMVQLPNKILDQIDRALGRIEHEQKIFDEWGLYAIMPNPVSALGFFGPPGTGKTLAAEAIAQKLGKKIVRVSYAEIENKYVGEGPKNVKAVFYAAEKQDAVLFIDEADSLLSKRLTNVSDGTGQAFNSMRSQLLMSLENYHGIVIFATNLVVNYDKAFLSRIISIEFTNPDAELRKKIWETHLLPKTMNDHDLRIPLADDVDIEKLAQKYDLCGRDIRNAVIEACVESCKQNKDKVDQECLEFGAESRVESNKAVAQATDYTTVERESDSAKEMIAKIAEKKLKSKESEHVSINTLEGKGGNDNEE